MFDAIVCCVWRQWLPTETIRTSSKLSTVLLSLVCEVCLFFHECPVYNLQIPIPDVYAGVKAGAVDDEAMGEYYASYVNDALKECERNGGVAAFIAESVLGCAGQVSV